MDQVYQDICILFLLIALHEEPPEWPKRFAVDGLKDSYFGLLSLLCDYHVNFGYFGLASMLVYIPLIVPKMDKLVVVPKIIKFPLFYSPFQIQKQNENT